MPKPSYRLLALDVDRTLLPLSGQLSDANRTAVQQAVAAGCEVVPVSGRRWGILAPFCRDLPGVRYVVASDGVVVKRVTDGSTLRRLPLELQTAQTVRRMLPDMPNWLYHLEASETENEVLIHSTEGPDWFTKLIERYSGKFDIGDPESPAYASRLNLMWTSGEMQQLQQAAETLRAALGNGIGLNTVSGVPGVRNLLDVFHPEAGKWGAVLYVAQMLNVQQTEIFAMGDDANDISMLRGAGLGVAVADAANEVRAAANVVGPRCEHDAVAWAINEFVLK